MRTANSEGAYGSFTSAYVFNLDLPNPPAITGPTSPTADATPLVTWTEPTTLPGDSYQLQVYNVNLGTLVYDTTGLTGVQHEVTTALNAGYQYSAYMRTANASGDYGVFTNPYYFDVVLPAAPTVTAPPEYNVEVVPVVKRFSR